ncbi:DgyrCDS4941 [Dimorphilus gyrociliatus]|uniref:DgyrCDS4941 n=1 Tax=Dimorphilus gyrociliatus TaxID=2664684 RepID=A0A7I8VL25_9ANNE|nr:DgyrCDS4941 [Dimorphilus gyrociliatus]
MFILSRATGELCIYIVKRRHSTDHVPFKRTFSRVSTRSKSSVKTEDNEDNKNIFSNIRGSIRRSLRLKVHNKLQKTAMKGQEDYNLPNLENDLQYMRFISAQKKKRGTNLPKEIALEQKIEQELKLRNGAIKLLSACSKQSESQQSLEAAKSLFMSNMRMKSLMDKLRTEENRSSACLGKVSVSSIKVPLLWREKENLKPGKFTGRNFVAFAVLKIDSEVFDTQLVYVTPENNNLAFEDICVFPNVSYNFNCELEIYCHRLGYNELPSSITTSSTAASTPRKLKNRLSKISDSITRSFSRKLSTMVKIEESDGTMIIGPKFDLLASTTLTLQDVCEKGKTLDLRLEDSENNPVNKLQLFGHLVCRVAAIPYCLTDVTLVGYLSINCNRGGGWCPYFCELRSMQLSCWEDKSDVNKMAPVLTIRINKDVQITQLPETSNSTLPGHCRDSLLINTVDASFEILAASNRELRKWWNALQQHLVDQALWQHACDYQMSMEPTLDLTDSEIRPVTKYRRRSSTAPTLGVRALLHERIGAYNLDVNTVLANKGDDNSAFGYSIAQHWDGKRATLLVGSPLHSSTYNNEIEDFSCKHSSLLENELYRRKPGSTFQCDIEATTKQLNNCSYWITGWETCLPTALYKLEGLKPNSPYNVQESRRGMGLGTVVHSSSKDRSVDPLKYESLACAPLWSTVLNTEEKMFTMGTCFREPIETPPSRRAKGYDWFTFSRPAKLNLDSRSDIQDIFQFFHNSAQGFSVDSNKKSQVQVAGAPLANFFRGGFIISLIGDEEEYKGKNNRDETAKVGRYVLHYPTGNNRLKRLDKIHYSGMLGYSVALLSVTDPKDPRRFDDKYRTSFTKCLAYNNSNDCRHDERMKLFKKCSKGDFEICRLSTLELTPHFYSNVGVVAGAPALETSSGALVLFRVIALKNPSFAYKEDPYPMRMMWQYNSTEIGERLGTSLLSMDINGDGFDDIISGAPYYTNEKRTKGGRVYLFLSNGKDLVDSDVYPEPVKIAVDQTETTNCAKKKCYSFQFGKSLANAGDLDGDGIDDLAVGAPYEDLGAVYIFSGGSRSQEEWKNVKPSQKITVDSLGDESVKQILNKGTFGWSLSGGLDMNDDGLIDLSVGAYKSDAVLSLFSRPVVFVKWSFKYPQNFDYESKTFEFRVCAEVTGSRPSISKILNSMNYVIYEDLSTGAPQRFKIDDEIGKKKGVLMETIALNTKICETFTLKLLDNTRDLISGLRLTIVIEATQPDKVLGNQIKLVNYPAVMDKDKIRSKIIPFKTTCQQVPCRCDLVTKVKPNLPLIDPRENVYLFDTKENINNTIRMDFTVENNGEEAHDPKLIIEPPDSFRLINFVKTENSRCFTSLNTSVITCNLKAPLKQGEKSVVAIDFQFQLSLSSSLSLFRAEAKSISEETHPESNIVINRIKASVTINLSLRGLSSPDSLFIEGDIRGASSFNSTKQIGPPVQHIFNVRNEGNFTVQNVRLVVHFPYELKPLDGDDHGKYLFYVEKIPNVECFIKPEYVINPENYIIGDSKTVSSQKSVSKRSVGDSTGEDYGNSVSDGTTLKVGCKLLGARCAVITCVFKRINTGQSADVKIYARAWNTTFLQEFAEYETVHVQSEASLEYGENLFDRTPENNNFTIITEIQTSKIFEKKGIKIWHIILAAIGGFLILLVVLFLCWKCGFFKRSKRDEMYVYQGKKRKTKDNL